MDIGQRVREIRKDLGMSAAELARRTGVARNTIVMIEAGRRTPSLGLVEKIARELRTEPADLFKEPEWRLHLLEPLAPAATALNALFGPKVDANDFTIEEYEQVGEAFVRLDDAAAVAVRGVNLHSEEGASAAVREAFNRAGGYHSGGPMYELRHTLQRAYEELVRREKTGVPNIDELRHRVA
jgi:putative transcriptional regulator